tara:strand:- start:910 stop:1059 length:150 start_codon:yes stop_codon:yes gene_type:complete
MVSPKSLPIGDFGFILFAEIYKRNLIFMQLNMCAVSIQIRAMTTVFGSV